MISASKSAAHPLTVQSLRQRGHPAERSDC